MLKNGAIAQMAGLELCVTQFFKGIHNERPAPELLPLFCGHKI
jgi:hypothetical protein